MDHLVAAAFSMWRAVFLAETPRDWGTVKAKREEFLARVVADNAIAYSDDKTNRAWTVGYYLDNARLRLLAALQIAQLHHPNDEELKEVPEWLKVIGDDVELTRYEWDSAYASFCILFNILDYGTKLDPRRPPMPEPRGLEKFFT